MIIKPINRLAYALIILSNSSIAKTGMNDLPSPSHDKKIQFIIENYNKKKLNLLIKPQLPKGRHGETLHANQAGWVALKVPPSLNDASAQVSEFSIPINELGAFQYYSITGETNSLTPIGTCYNLKAGKCYRITFIDNLFGTECISSEYKGPIPHTQGRVIPSRKSLPAPYNQNIMQPIRPSEVLTAREDED